MRLMMGVVVASALVLGGCAGEEKKKEEKRERRELEDWEREREREANAERAAYAGDQASRGSAPGPDAAFFSLHIFCWLDYKKQQVACSVWSWRAYAAAGQGWMLED